MIENKSSLWFSQGHALAKEHVDDRHHCQSAVGDLGDLILMLRGRYKKTLLICIRANLTLTSVRAPQGAT